MLQLPYLDDGGRESGLEGGVSEVVTLTPIRIASNSADWELRAIRTLLTAVVNQVMLCICIYVYGRLENSTVVVLTYFIIFWLSVVGEIC